MELTARRRAPSSGRRLRRLALSLAISAGVVLLALLGHAFVQLPSPIFVAAALAGVWLGIASLFSP